MITSGDYVIYNDLFLREIFLHMHIHIYVGFLLFSVINIIICIVSLFAVCRTRINDEFNKNRNETDETKIQEVSLSQGDDFEMV